MVETDEEKKVREEKEETDKKAAEEADAKAKADADAEAAKASPAKKEETKSPLEEARALDKSIKEGTAKMQALLEKNEKVMADAAISGKGFAGQAESAKKTEDEKWAEEAKKRYEGTGMDPTTPMKEVTYS
jgi:translation initiation factor 4G